MIETNELEKIANLLQTGKEEDKTIAIQLANSVHPLLWACLSGFVESDGRSSSSITAKNLIAAVYKNKEWSPGNVVKYRGLENSPNMIVVNVKVSTSTSAAKMVSYSVKLQCRYFNDRTQTFSEVEDKVECFEKVEIKK